MKKIGMMSLIIFILALGVSVGYAQPTDTDNAILFADFKDGTIPEDLNLSDIWQVVPQTIDGEARQVIFAEVTEQTGIEGFLFSPPDNSTGDYSFEIKMRFDRSPDFSMYTRLDGDSICDGGYTFDYFSSNAASALYRFTGGDDCDLERLSDDAAFDILPEVWFTVRVDLQGSAINIYVDDEEIIAAQDANHTSGVIGFRIFEPTLVEVDYVTLLPLEATATGMGGTMGNAGESGSGGLGGSVAGGGTGDTAGTQTTATPITPTQTVVTLENHNAQNWQDTIAELESLNLIPTDGGALLFRENFVFARGGSGYVPLARSSQLQDVVISANISSTISAEDSCAIMFRFLQQSGSNLVSYVELRGDGSLGLADTSETTYADLVPDAIDTTAENHILIVAIGADVLVFLNGRLTLQSDAMALRDGSFGLSLFGGNSSDCEAEPFWVYRYQ